MKPIILTDPDDRHRAWLADAGSASSLHEKITGRSAVHYETAVEIGDLAASRYRVTLDPAARTNDQPGEILTPPIAGLWEANMCLPFPCVIARTGKELLSQGFNNDQRRALSIYEPAAIVMLRLAAAFLNVHTSRVTESFHFNPARSESPKSLPTGSKFIAWDSWKFHLAWHWSAWHEREIHGEKLSIARRFDEFRLAGYPNGLKAFEAMHRTLFPRR